jgi:hypothetical protein
MLAGVYCAVNILTILCGLAVLLYNYKRVLVAVQIAQGFARSATLVSSADYDSSHEEDEEEEEGLPPSSKKDL